jgi:hypothetical protein
MFQFWCIFPSISSQPEGALPGTLWNVGMGAAPAGVGRTSLCALGGPWVTVRAHYGALPSMAGRERVKGGETCLDQRAGLVPAAGSAVPRTKKSPRRNVERRCRVPLFPGDPGNKPRLLPRCAFRRSASLFSGRGRFTEPTIHVKEFAGSDDAWPEERAMHRCHPRTAVIARLDRATQYSRGGSDRTATPQSTRSPLSRG